MADCKESKEPDEMESSRPQTTGESSANDEAEVLVNRRDSNNSPVTTDRQSSDSECIESSDLSDAEPSYKSSESKKDSTKATKLSIQKSSLSFGTNSSDSSSSKPKSSLLRPSQLNAVSSLTTKSVLQPPRLQNPFCKAKNDLEENVSSTTSENSKDHTPKDTENEEKNKEEKEKLKEPPKFLALSKSTNAKENENSINNSVTASTSTPSFVFGQNLKERIANAHDADNSNSSDKEETKQESSNENGSSDMMFTNAAAVCKSTTKPSLSLTEAAHEMEEASRANKRKYSEVTLLTGEEDELNVLQINCKLFAFDKASSGWQERGRGSLRLNDKDDESRLVGRAAGTQRLVLNTKVWPGMTVERAGPKSLRLTAMDVQGDIRIFVVQAAQKEVEQLHNLLMQRLKRAQERQPKKQASEH